MAETASSSLLDIALDRVPVIMFITHLVAIDTDWNHLLELTDFRRVFQYPLRHPQAHANRFAIERLRKKIVHSRCARHLIVIGAGVICGEKDEISVGGSGMRSDLFAQSQPIETRHHPVTHN